MRNATRSKGFTVTGLLAPLLLAMAMPASALDINSAEDAAEVMMKMRCSLDPKQDVIAWWKGTLFQQEPGPGKAPVALMGFEGYNICRSEKLEDGTWRMLSRELTFYRDLKTGKILETWDNPISGERNTVVDVANDPVNHVQNPPGRPQMPLPWVKTPGWLMLTWNIPLAYPNPLHARAVPAPVVRPGVCRLGALHVLRQARGHGKSGDQERAAAHVLDAHRTVAAVDGAGPASGRAAVYRPERQARIAQGAAAGHPGPGAQQVSRIRHRPGDLGAAQRHQLDALQAVAAAKWRQGLSAATPLRPTTRWPEPRDPYHFNRE
jgi:hypothetical protein